MRNLTCILILFVSIGPPLAAQQDLQKQINQSRKNLDGLKSEIRNYELRLATEAVKEKTELEHLNDVDQRIGLMQRLLGELENSRDLTEINIAVLRRQLAKTEEELSDLQKQTGARLNQIYRTRDEDPLTYIFTADSWTQAYARVKYLRHIGQQDKIDIQTLRKKHEKITRQKRAIEAELLQLSRLLTQKREEKRNLDIQLKRRQESLSKIRRDKRLLASLLEEKRDDLETLSQLIVTLERKKREMEEIERQKKLAAQASNQPYKQPKYFTESNFASYKGRLPYPVAGRIIKKFGDQVHPVLGTKTRNPGVEIEAGTNRSVQTVAKGQIAHVAWLRRMGNTVLIDHGKGYYTVYAHLAEIYVSVGQIVNAGDTIALLDQNDEGKYVLHFEIYQNQSVQDPQRWLD
ncbi:MAG: peptidoglycan DD-metalloendopeptidase family protein [Bacteroidetes bacterium]|nr:peptidoglycan DD-metalloendopeptidase family protein [Bacteroidota bacterium]